MRFSRARAYTAKVLYRISPDMDPGGTFDVIYVVIRNLPKEASQRLWIDFFLKKLESCKALLISPPKRLRTVDLLEDRAEEKVDSLLGCSETKALIVDSTSIDGC